MKNGGRGIMVAPLQYRMFRKTYWSQLSTRLSTVPRARLVALIVLVALGGMLPGMGGAVWLDWSSRGGYEPLSYYVSNAWNSWRASGEEAPSVSVARRIDRRQLADMSASSRANADSTSSLSR
jgi:hypothetical protein